LVLCHRLGLGRVELVAGVPLQTFWQAGCEGMIGV